jgi:hypothetical protein
VPSVRSVPLAEAIVQQKTRVLDFDLRAYFDNVRHDWSLEKLAQRVDDADVMHLLKVMLKASGKKGVPQGRVISPLLSNLYLNEVDRMLERAREVTRNGKYTYIEYARFADDSLINSEGARLHRKPPPVPGIFARAGAYAAPVGDATVDTVDWVSAYQRLCTEGGAEEPAIP